ncbi:MAG: MarR family winged helix-turn-helix transcriptional regulator [Anaerovoracaceae bacterium]|nr:MarR family winged helix-turn-helix transcriptional regulator [Bacillota bacterium]MDY2670047.1 MarR family winged helix-turn-helix transcriptional regulator [Anaerovoracaceae bacterium]
MDDLQKQICRFCSAQHEISMAYEEYARQKGYSFTSMQIMQIIYNNPGCTQKRLNELTLLPKQTINAVVSNLYSNGMISMRENPLDRRCKAIYYSEEGEKTAELFFSGAEDIVETCMNELNDDERDFLIRIMEKLARLMNEEVRK